ncbi:MAG: nucleotidyltransferase domain-containing protein [Amnibacterium sp.]
MQHHDEAVARYVKRTAGRDGTVAIALTGSLARGEERHDSDVDLLLVVDEATWSAAVANERVMWTETDGIAYPGGYYDVKLATADLLDAVAERGDDPVRDSLATAKPLFSHSFDLAGAIRRAGERSEAQWRDLTASFVAQARLHGGYFLDAGLDHADPLLTAHAAVHLATSASRAVLARRHVRFPGPKQLGAALRRLPGAPAGFADAVDAVVRTPSRGSADALLALLEAAVGPVLAEDRTLSRFVRDNELAWFTGVPAPEYR